MGARAEGGEPADLWYLSRLVECAARVLARSHAADLVFVGRSLDSMHDLLTGAYAGTPREGGRSLRRLPISLRGLYAEPSPRERSRLREHLDAAGLSPSALARRSRQVALTDVVSSGTTFDVLHRELARWIGESGEPWPVIRRKLRYVGVTVRGKTSPNHRRWQQSAGSAPWVRTLPAGHVVNVSLEFEVWGWLGNWQPKTAPSFARDRWFDEECDGPVRHPELPDALSDALALVEAGRSRAVRDELVRVLGREPAFAERPVRELAHALRHGRGGRRPARRSR
ncbi:hypothetical protein E0L36_06730 [Streptomyces sp. AJS327]|nr:hypothetical protein [Streptomyces sp. AJS327]